MTEADVPGWAAADAGQAMQQAKNGSPVLGSACPRAARNRIPASGACAGLRSRGWASPACARAARLAELARARDQLAAFAERAAARDPADCQGYCPILAS